MSLKRTPHGGLLATTRTARWYTEITRGLLDLRPETRPKLFGDVRANPRRLVVVDRAVMDLHGAAILAQLDAYGIDYGEPLVIHGGDENKTDADVRPVHLAMEAAQLSRFGVQVLAWGGGVLHDLVGYAAATYRRGIEWRYFGTTLVAAVDAMFALKSAVNLVGEDGKLIKNRLGRYEPASESYADPAFFATLTPEQVRDGTGEVFKFALCGSPSLFRLLEVHGARIVREQYQGDDPDTAEVLRRTVAGMMRELHDNPLETNPQRKSYLGHNFSPVLEPELVHGQAVILDALVTSAIARGRGLLSTPHFERIAACIEASGLLLWHPALDAADLYAGLQDTARHRGGRQLVPVPDQIGRVTFIDDISPAELTRAVAAVRSLA